MSSFEKAIPVVLRNEGGWVDNPIDPGGETNFGISMLMVKREGMTPEQLGIPDFELGSMKLMKVEVAVEIYRKLFWDKHGYGRIIDDACATKVFDCGVNCGPKRSHMMAQRAVNSCESMPLVHVDGILGAASIAAINSVDPNKFLCVFRMQMEDYYRELVAEKPALEVFLKNWLHRASWLGYFRE